MNDHPTWPYTYEGLNQMHAIRTKIANSTAERLDVYDGRCVTPDGRFGYVDARGLFREYPVRIPFSGDDRAALTHGTKLGTRGGILADYYAAAPDRADEALNADEEHEANARAHADEYGDAERAWRE